MQTLEIIGAVIGLIYLYLEYKANRWLWLFGVIMPVVYIVIFSSIWGWMVWTKKKKNSAKNGKISHTPTRFIVPLTLAGIAIFALIAFILVNYTDSPVPYGDAFTTALSIIAMWMLAFKYIEQWGLWFVVNSISCGLYFWKDLYYTSGLFAVYAVISIFGYLEWKRMMRQETGFSS